MAANTNVMRGPKDLRVKTRLIAATNTTGKALAAVPKGSRLVGAFLHGAVTAVGQTATLGFGTNDTATNLGTFDVTTAGKGTGGFVAFTNTTYQTADTTVYGIFGNSGTGTSTAGSWVVSLVYTDGNAINDGTI